MSAAALRSVSVVIALTLLAVATPATAEGGFGVSPGDLDYGDVLRGEPVLREFSVHNSREAPIEVRLAPDGELADWIDATPTWFVVLPGEAQTVRAELSVPRDAASGVHEAALVATTGGERPEGSGVSVALAVRIGLRASVGGSETMRMEGGDVSVADTEEGTPVRVGVVLINSGNVRASADIEARFIDVNGALLHAETKAAPVVRPGVQEAVTLVYEPTLSPGQYFVDVAGRVRGETIFTERATFDVLRAGDLKRSGTMGTIRALGEPVKTDETLLERASVDEGAPAPQRFVAGKPFLLTVPFTNDGLVQVTAVFRGVMIQGEKLVRTVESDPIKLGPGEETTFRIMISDVRAAGQYSVVGAVHYDGKVTPENESILMLVEGEGIPSAGLLLAGAALATAALARRGRR